MTTHDSHLQCRGLRKIHDITNPRFSTLYSTKTHEPTLFVCIVISLHRRRNQEKKCRKCHNSPAHGRCHVERCAPPAVKISSPVPATSPQLRAPKTPKTHTRFFNALMRVVGVLSLRFCPALLTACKGLPQITSWLQVPKGTCGRYPQFVQ